MNRWQIIIGIFIIVILSFSFYYFYKEFRARRKIPYHKLFEKKKKEYLVRNNRFIAWMVAVFFISVFSVGFLFRITLISTPLLLGALAVITLSNILFFRYRYRIKSKQDLGFLSVVIGLGQLSLLLWLNYLPVGKHYEQYRIDRKEIDEGSNITIIHLENNKMDEFWMIRTFESNSAPMGDTIIYEFREGLIGFRVYESHISV